MLRKRTWILVSFALYFCSTVCAGTYTWNNSAGGDWETASNWLPVKQPAQGDEVDINGAGFNQITLGSDAIIKSVLLESGTLAIISDRSRSVLRPHRPDIPLLLAKRVKEPVRLQAHPGIWIAVKPARQDLTRDASSP